METCLDRKHYVLDLTACILMSSIIFIACMLHLVSRNMHVHVYTYMYSLIACTTNRYTSEHCEACLAHFSQP